MSPLEIGDVAGWLLCAMGIIFNGAAAFDRWKMDDPYPGYGELARRREELENEYVAQKQEIEDDLAGIKDSALGGIDALSSEIEGRREEYRAINLSRTSLNDLFQGHIRYLEQCGNELLTAYRYANTSKRTVDAPRHFREQWRVPTITHAAGSPDPPIIDLEDMLRQLLKARTKILEAFRNSMEEFYALGTLGRGVTN